MMCTLTGWVGNIEHTWFYHRWGEIKSMHGVKQLPDPLLQLALKGPVLWACTYIIYWHELKLRKSHRVCHLNHHHLGATGWQLIWKGGRFRAVITCNLAKDRSSRTAGGIPSSIGHIVFSCSPNDSFPTCIQKSKIVKADITITMVFLECQT